MGPLSALDRVTPNVLSFATCFGPSHAVMKHRLNEYIKTPKATKTKNESKYKVLLASFLLTVLSQLCNPLLLCLSHAPPLHLALSGDQCWSHLVLVLGCTGLSEQYWDLLHCTGQNWAVFDSTRLYFAVLG